MAKIYVVFKLPFMAGQLIATSHDMGPQKVANRKGNPLSSGKSAVGEGWDNLVHILSSTGAAWKGAKGVFWVYLKSLRKEELYKELPLRFARN